MKTMAAISIGVVTGVFYLVKLTVLKMCELSEKSKWSPDAFKKIAAILNEEGDR